MTGISLKLIDRFVSDVAGSKSSVKLKASDIYSDDSGSDSEDKRSGRRSSTSSRSSSDSETDGASKAVAGRIRCFLSSDKIQKEQKKKNTMSNQTFFLI